MSSRTIDDLVDLKRAYLAWVASGTHNQWLEHDGVHLYVRRSQRLLGSERAHTLDIASISVKHPGQGTLTRLLPWLEAHSPMPAVWVENILSDRLLAWFEARGYVRHDPRGDFPHSVYRILPRRRA